MPKKSSVNISGIVILRTIIFLFIGFVLFTGYVNAHDFLTTSPLFEIKEVMLDRSIQFIDVRSLRDLKGKNIFKVDLHAVDRQITSRYPYISQLRVVRQLPDRILVLAKKREPLLQIYYKHKYLLIDTEDVPLYYTNQPANLPLVVIPVERSWSFSGGPWHSAALAKVVDILNMFKQSPNLQKWRIHAVQAVNLAKIDLSVGENMHVMLDQDDTQDKIELLEVLISSNKIDLNKVKYIDLRFKEPVIADNIDDQDKKRQGKSHV